MKILVVSQYFWPENFRVNELVSELVARKHDVTVLTGRPNYPDGDIFPEYSDFPESFGEYEGAQVLRVPLRPRGKGRLRLVLNYMSFIFWASVLGLWKLRGRPFDAVFVFASSPITSALPALLIGRVKRAPVAVWVLDLWPETLSAVRVVTSRPMLRVVGVIVSFIYRRCDRILVQSRAFYQSIQRWAGQTSTTRYIPNWVERAYEAESDVQPAPEVAAFANTFNVMFAGNVGEAQDFPAILAAAESLRGREELRWLIVGDGRAMSMVREEIARRGLQDRVFLLGRHPAERMAAFFVAADALLVSLRAHPVFAMTIPGKVQTYMAAGVPLLGMLDGEGARVIAESGAGLVCPSGDATGLAARVEELLAMDPQVRAQMGRAGQAYCQREFGRDPVISRLEQVLVEMSSRAPGGAQEVPV